MTTRAMIDGSLSRRQQDVYDYVRMFIGDNGYSPTIREIADGIMLSSASTVHSHVNSLIRKGYLTQSSGGVRTLALTKKGKQPKVVTQAGIMKWIEEKGNDHQHDSNIAALLIDLQESIQTGRIC